MNATMKEKTAALLAAISGGYSCYAFFMTHERGPIIWRILAGVLFVLWLTSLWQWLCRKSWALVVSLILTLAALALGVYYVHFAWNFWLFQEPTLLERIIAVLRPPILVLAAWPLIWCWYLLCIKRCGG